MNTYYYLTNENARHLLKTMQKSYINMEKSHDILHVSSTVSRGPGCLVLQSYFQHLEQCLVQKNVPKKHLLNGWILKAGYRTIIIRSISLSFLPPPTHTHTYNWKIVTKGWHVMEFFLYSSLYYLNFLHRKHFLFDDWKK